MIQELKQVKLYNGRTMRTITILFLLTILMLAAFNVMPTKAAKEEELRKEMDELSKDVEDLNETMSKLSEDVKTVNETIAWVLETAKNASGVIDETLKTIEDVNKTSSEAKELAESAKESANLAKDAAKDVKEKVSEFKVIVYGAIGVSLVAVAAGIRSIILLKKKGLID